MRIRKKIWADEELKTNERLVENPKIYKGRWHEYFKNDNPIHLEIGCGKGRFSTTMANQNPNVNYIAMERQTQVMVTALKKARETNAPVGFIIEDVANLPEYFEAGEVKRLYINFCDPWPRKKKWAKRRLTHANFLALYETLFGAEGEVFFKTDNKILFEFSLNEFSNQGWRLQNISLDLHKSDYEGNVMTEYEQKFSGNGFPIYRCEAKFTKS